MDSDVSVARSARVSLDAAWRAGIDKGSDHRLINYLWKNKHTTPFESVTFTFEVKAPIFVLRQWHRHRTQSYNELSARYRELPEEFYVPEILVIGTQSKSNKQGRDTTFTVEDQRAAEVEVYKIVCESSFAQYKILLDKGWPKELARLCLPVSTYSHMFTTLNLLNLFKFCTLRCDPHAQYEIRVYADAMIELIRPIVPTCVEAWESENKKGPAEFLSGPFVNDD